MSTLDWCHVKSDPAGRGCPTRSQTRRYSRAPFPPGWEQQEFCKGNRSSGQEQVGWDPAPQSEARLPQRPGPATCPMVLGDGGRCVFRRTTADAAGPASLSAVSRRDLFMNVLSGHNYFSHFSVPGVCSLLPANPVREVRLSHPFDNTPR